MDSCVCEKAVTHSIGSRYCCGVDLSKVLSGKWETCPEPHYSIQLANGL